MVVILRSLRNIISRETPAQRGQPGLANTKILTAPIAATHSWADHHHLVTSQKQLLSVTVSLSSFENELFYPNDIFLIADDSLEVLTFIYKILHTEESSFIYSQTLRYGSTMPLQNKTSEETM